MVNATVYKLPKTLINDIIVIKKHKENTIYLADGNYRGC